MTIVFKGSASKNNERRDFYLVNRGGLFDVLHYPNGTPVEEIVSELEMFYRA